MDSDLFRACGRELWRGRIAMKVFHRFFALFLFMVFCAALLPAGAVGSSYTVSGSYAESVYYENLQNLTLTGDYRTDLVNVALTQVR